MASHAYCPTALAVEGDRIRVLCAFLDAERIGRCGWVDVDSSQPQRVLDVSERPTLEVGEPGTFDEHGVTPLSVVRLTDGRVRLYYAGWQRGVGVRYTLFTGVAHSEDDGLSFARVSEVPVLDRADGELHMRTGVHVRRASDGWRMWYAGGSEWVGSGADAKPRYALRHLHSADGLAWPGRSQVCLPPRSGELGFGRPCVVGSEGLLRMWYSLRTTEAGYRLGYAESEDGLDWRRLDEQAGLDHGPAGAWDSEMVGLSSLIETGRGDTLMFYNGNGYGATGFGVAIAEGA
jgi:hypothetical protein